MRLFPLRRNHFHAFSLGLCLLTLSGCNEDVGYEEPGEKITVENKYGELVGRLMVPEDTDKKIPAVIIIPDSGAIDRNGNSAYTGLRSNAYIQLSARLAEKGIAALRYDKAGMAYSASAAPSDEEDVRFEMGAKDAALFTAALRDDPRIGPITLVGHGDGALLAMLSHGEEEADAVVSLAAGAYSLDVYLREEIEEEITDKKVREEALAILDKLVAGKKVKEVSASLLGLFRPTVQPYLISWIKHDPAEELAKLDVPTLIVHGTSDLEIAPEEADVLAEASPDSMLTLIKGMNHVLKLDSGKTITKQANQSYSDPSWELAPDLVKVLAKFVKQ